MAAALLVLALAACATPQAERLVRDPGALPARAELTTVPFFPQELYYCGPAALAMVLAWSGLPVTQEDMVPQVYSPEREGTLRTDIVGAARRNGRLAVPVTTLADLLAELAAGHPVLVFQNLALDWFPQWHFAVAIGYDLEAREIVLHSGLDERRVTVLDTFENTWRRGDYWALVVLPPDTLPARADATAVVQAAAGLERVGRHRDAVDAYGTILGRWPGNFAAGMGLGNAYYGAGNLAAAEMSFRGVTGRHPMQAAGWNNLAHVLAERGLKAEAVVAARRAVEIGGRDIDTYRTTLRTIETGQ